MKNATTKKRDMASNRSEVRVSMKNRLIIIATSALLLVATSATAGIIFLPGSNVYANPELAPVNVQHLGNDIVRIHTTDLTGELTLKGSDFPPEYEVPASATGKLFISQELELVINLSLGVVEGRASGQYLNNTELWDWRLHADVQGKATCLPLNGRECGQLVVDLELRGALSDPNNPASVGQMRMKMLGSLIWDDTDMMRWAAMSANATLGVNEVMINSFLDKDLWHFNWAGVNMKAGSDNLTLENF
jgi:hypothetical protein